MSSSRKASYLSRIALTCALLVSIAVSGFAHSQSGVVIPPDKGARRSGPVPVSYEVVTFADTAIGLSNSTLTVAGEPVNTCSGVVESGSIRFRVDGTAPTSSDGQPVTPGQWLQIDGLSALAHFRGIRSTSTSGIVRFTCYLK